jgi:hypothetical protein
MKTEPARNIADLSGKSLLRLGVGAFHLTAAKS